MKDLMNHRAVRLLVSVVLTFLFMGILVVCTSDKDPNRILVMLGGTMPEGLIQGFTYFLFFFGMCEVAWISGRITHENDAFSAHLLPEKENWVLSAVCLLSFCFWHCFSEDFRLQKKPRTNSAQ